MYQYLKKVNHFANIGSGYISLFFQQLTVPAMGFSIRLSHRHLKLDMSKWASLSPSLLPDLLHFLGPLLSWMSSSPIQVSKPGIWLHAGLLPLLHPAQATRLSTSPMDSVSCDSPPLISSSATANIWVQSLISYQYCCDCSLLRLCSYFKLLPEKTSQNCKTVHIGWYVSVDVFFFVSVSGGKRKKSSEKPSLRVSQRVPVQLHTSCSEKQESERPKAKVLVLHGRPTKIHFSAPLFSPWGGAPFLEVLQYQVRARSGWSNLVSQLPAPKIHLIYCPWIEGVSDIKLVSVGNFKGANKGRRYLLLLLAASSCLCICLKAERKFLHVFIY